MVDQVKNHEVLDLFSTHLHPLSEKLTEMLNEHYSHQTERRGCGYTQATRVMAEYINLPRNSTSFDDLKLFENYDLKSLKTIINNIDPELMHLSGWRALDQQPQISAYLALEKNDSLSEALNHEKTIQSKLRQMSGLCTLEESTLICDFIEDIILPKTAEATGLTEIKVLSEKPKVGSCPMAEKFFLKVAHHQLLRQGIINIYVDHNQEPVMMEKLNMGDNHSCISLKPLIMNGVRLPAGSLFAIQYDDDALTKKPNKKYNGSIIAIDQVSFYFLRITTLAISPENRSRAFSTHFKQQIQNGLLNPERTLLKQITDVAIEQIT